MFFSSRESARSVSKKSGRSGFGFPGLLPGCVFRSYHRPTRSYKVVAFKQERPRFRTRGRIRTGTPLRYNILSVARLPFRHTGICWAFVPSRPYLPGMENVALSGGCAAPIRTGNTSAKNLGVTITPRRNWLVNILSSGRPRLQGICNGPRPWRRCNNACH